MKQIFGTLILLLLIGASFWNCEKLYDGRQLENDEHLKNGTFQLSVGDSRVDRESKKNESALAAQLSQFEITIGGIWLKNELGEYVSISETPFTLDLRQYQGSVKKLDLVNIPFSYYYSIRIQIDAVHIKYASCNYTASSDGALVHLDDLGIDISEGIPNELAEPTMLDIPIPFLNNKIETCVRLFFDALASCKSNSVNLPLYGDIDYVTLRDNFNVSAILEENIQQIAYSPPLGIQYNAQDEVPYYGLHTFIDFASTGGTIGQHSSQHIFRGENMDVFVAAEENYTNNRVLLPSGTVAAEGESVVRSDEIFKFESFKTNLAKKGYTLESGKTYYFSLHKTWTINEEEKTYNISRTCEPIAIVWP